MQKMLNDPLKSFVHHEQTGALWQLSDLFLNYIPFDQEIIFVVSVQTGQLGML